MSPQFPREPFFEGFDAPCRFEAELHDCIIDGQIPNTIDGTFYRVAADTLHVPKHPKDVPFNGDGAIAAFRIRDGGVDFRTKFVRTEKFVRERAARRALVGQYRNPFTDDPAVVGTNRTTANTNVVWLYGHLLALKEDALPYELDPHTLETIGTYDFAKQYTAPTFTAHPKVDPSNGETICYGYETKGLGSKDVKYVLFDGKGKKIEDFDFQAPYCGLMHDVAFTANFVIFQIYPLQTDKEWLKRGGPHWYYNKTLPMYLCMIPRYSPKAQDVKWFHWEPNWFEGHYSNAFEKDGIVYCDFPIMNGNVMSFFPPIEEPIGAAPPRGAIPSYFARFKLDPNATDVRLPNPERIGEISGEFSRIDDRFLGEQYQWTFIAATDVSRPYDQAKALGRPFMGFNCVGRINNKTKTTDYWWAGPTASVGEPCFIPRSPDSPEGDGFVVALVNRFDTNLSDLVILDTKNFQKEIAMVHLPFRVRAGFHGNWVNRSEMGNVEDSLVDMSWVPQQYDGAVDPRIRGKPTDVTSD